MTPSQTTTEFLLAAQSGDQSAVEELFPIVYDELKSIAHRHLESNSHPRNFSSTGLVHEVYLKLIDQSKVNVRSRTHFLALGSRVMRQILVDKARHNKAIRRGGGAPHVSIEDNLLTRKDDSHVLAVEEALKHLEELDSDQAKIVEMRFFGGMTVAEVAEYMGKSKRWVETEWTMIRAWLRKELES